MNRLPPDPRLAYWFTRLFILTFLLFLVAGVFFVACMTASHWGR